MLAAMDEPQPRIRPGRAADAAAMAALCTELGYPSSEAQIRERLLRVRGVANVAIWGERIQMPQIQVDPQRMAAHGVTVDDVLQTTSDTLDSGMIQYSSGATVGTGGFLETPNQRLYIRHVQPILTADDLARVAERGDVRRKFLHVLHADAALGQLAHDDFHQRGDLELILGG